MILVLPAAIARPGCGRNGSLTVGFSTLLALDRHYETSAAGRAGGYGGHESEHPKGARSKDKPLA